MIFWVILSALLAFAKADPGFSYAPLPPPTIIKSYSLPVISSPPIIKAPLILPPIPIIKTVAIPPPIVKTVIASPPILPVHHGWNPW